MNVSTLLRTLRVSLGIGLLVGTTACAINVGKSIEEAAARKASSAKVTVDKTFGRYQQSLESRQILVTIEASEHYQLTTAGDGDENNEEAFPPAYQAFLDRFRERYQLERVVDWPIDSIGIYCIIFEIKGDRDREELVALVAQDPVIESAQAMQTFEVLQSDYNDPFHSLQHGFRSIGLSGLHQWATAVAGVIAAAADNNQGIVGVAPLADLFALKACWETSDDGKRAVCNSLTLAKALNYAINKQADIINLSLAGPPDPLLQRLVGKALEDNIIVVGAMPSHGRPTFPTSTPGTIAVSLPNNHDTGERLTTVSAPGNKVLSTRPGNRYDFYTGSSFSTAHIAGLAALLREHTPTLSPANVLALLQSSTDPSTGAVNACNALKALTGTNEQQC